MAEDIKENEMNSGKPARLRGIDVDGNSVSPTLQEVVGAMPMATTYSEGIMRAFHARKVEGVVYATSDKNLFVYKTTLNTWDDLYATFRICVLYASGDIEYADCFFVCVNKAGQIYFKKVGVLTAIIKSFVLQGIVYFYMEFKTGYGRAIVYPDFNLRDFELTDMTDIPTDAEHITPIQ